MVFLLCHGLQVGQGIVATVPIDVVDVKWLGWKWLPGEVEIVNDQLPVEVEGAGDADTGTCGDLLPLCVRWQGMPLRW